MVLTGEVGTGKTTLLKTVLSSFTERRISTAFVFNPRLDVMDFLEFVLADFRDSHLARTCKTAVCRRRNRGCFSAVEPVAHRPVPQRGAMRDCGRRSAESFVGASRERFVFWTNLETSSEKLVQIYSLRAA